MNGCTCFRKWFGLTGLSFSRWVELDCLSCPFSCSPVFSRMSRHRDFLFGLLLFVFLAVVSSTPTREFKVVSWNVNGVKKFRYLPTQQAFLSSHDVILLQETFSYEDEELFELPGFLAHHARAIPTGNSRHRWGLTTLFRTHSFADGFLEKLFSPCDWILISRWRQPGLPGLIVCNIYAPLHSRCVPAAPLTINLLCSLGESL
jgi:hypothetical protein